MPRLRPSVVDRHLSAHPSAVQGRLTHVTLRLGGGHAVVAAGPRRRPEPIQGRAQWRAASRCYKGTDNCANYPPDDPSVCDG